MKDGIIGSRILFRTEWPKSLSFYNKTKPERDEKITWHEIWKKIRTFHKFQIKACWSHLVTFKSEIRCNIFCPRRIRQCGTQKRLIWKIKWLKISKSIHEKYNSLNIKVTPLILVLFGCIELLNVFKIWQQKLERPSLIQSIHFNVITWKVNTHEDVQIYIYYIFTASNKKYSTLAKFVYFLQACSTFQFQSCGKLGRGKKSVAMVPWST